MVATAHDRQKFFIAFFDFLAFYDFLSVKNMSRAKTILQNFRHEINTVNIFYDESKNLMR
jgi:hypothetical protein